MKKSRPYHLCIRCMTNRTQTAYCPECRAVLKRPPFIRRAPLAPYAWERNDEGKRMRI